MSVSANKEKYSQFCEKTYVPIYSLPWWMDAVCGSENWDVWLYESGGEVSAAMPYYLEDREFGLYVTKAPLTQNNGIIFRYPPGQRVVAQAKFEERVIRAAMMHVDSMGLAVYEQQYQTTFTNWLPFYWSNCTAFPRYTYVIDKEKSIEDAWKYVSPKQRSVIRKGAKAVISYADIDKATFYQLHREVFVRQGLECPFSEELWSRLYTACLDRNRCRALGAMREDGSIASVIFLVWDERRMYHLLGGGMADFRAEDTYAALVWHAIELSREMGLTYDFEGSMRERISKSFREFGGTPELYFRIRKIYSSDVARMELDKQLQVIEAIHRGI